MFNWSSMVTNEGLINKPGIEQEIVQHVSGSCEYFLPNALWDYTTLILRSLWRNRTGVWYPTHIRVMP